MKVAEQRGNPTKKITPDLSLDEAGGSISLRLSEIKEGEGLTGDHL